MAGEPWSPLGVSRDVPHAVGARGAPADFDTGDHVNLTVDGYRALADTFDITTLGPDT
ncbi:hypothetical protein ACIA8I_04185 [Streptomyces rishiriensis]|uniref:hypothetical protein n=1 Tax=Streptomyces rishiriensis TaxID=68264 RepID=UPI00379B2634